MNNISNKPTIKLTASSPEHSAITITKFISYFTCSIALLYALYFWLWLEQPLIASINLLFVVAYSVPLLLAKYHQHFYAKLWFFAVLMVHVFILSTVIFTPSAGFHFYYLLLPSGVCLLLSEENKLSKLMIIALATGLFFLCENFQNEPLVVLSQEAEYWIFASTIVVIVVEIYVAMSIFSKTISVHEQELKVMATTDALTLINNRRTFMSIGDEIFAYAKRYDEPFSIILMDIDHFKKVNDQYGHLVGDKVLKNIAKLLRSLIRESDLLARYGGEEFILLLPNTPKDAALTFAENLRQQVEKSQVDCGNGLTVSCTLSLGVAEYQSNFITLDEITNAADQALYQAKKHGRNKVVSSANLLVTAGLSESTL